MPRNFAPAFRLTAASDRTIAWTIFVFLWAVYLATYSGAFTSIDELTLFGATDQVVRAGQLTSPLTAFRDYHNPISAFYEPGFSLLAVPLDWLAQRFQPVSNMQAALLLNPLLTAATGLLLYILGRRLGYGALPSLALALAFGLGTMAWPYAKTFLREPAAGLLWTLSLIGLVDFRARPTWRALLLAAVPALASVSIKVACVVIGPVVFAILAETLWRTRRIPRAWIGLAGLALAAGGAALVFIVLPLRGWSADSILARLFDLTPAGWLPVYGLLFSPGKSVFIFSPILLAAAVAWPAFYKRHSILALGLLGLWLVELLFVRTTSAWFGGLTWGPRYLLPLLPVSLLPLLEVFPTRRWTWAVAGASAAFQALAASASWAKVYDALFKLTPDPDLTFGLDWRAWRDTPAFSLLRRWGRGLWDLVWLRTDLAGELKIDFGLALWLGLGVLSLAGLVWLAGRGRTQRAALAVASAWVLLAAPYLLWRAYWNMPDYPDLAAAEARVLARQVPASPLQPVRLVNVSNDIYTYFWLGLVKGPLELAWISPAQADGFEKLLPPAGQRLAVVVDRPHIAGLYSADGLVDWLNLNAYRLGNGWLNGQEIFYYAAADVSAAPRAPAAARWANGLALTELAAPPTVAPGAVLPLDLRFTCPPAGRAADRLFAHLLSAAGALISGQDAPLQFGRLAAGGCPPGQSVLDRRGVWVPADAQPGEYALIVGFSNDAGYVPAALGAGEMVDDYARVLMISVSPAR